MTAKTVFTISLGLIFCFVVSISRAGDSISINNAWVKEAPPGVTTLAGYAVLKNNGKLDITLNKVESPYFELVELHESIIENGIAKMKKQDAILIKEKEIVEFQPGGLHLMLIKPHGRKKQGDAITLNFYFSDGSVTTVLAPVKKTVGKEQEHHHQHNH